MMELTKEEQIQAIYDLKVGYTLGPADIAILKAMARQLLAGMEQEEVGEVVLGDYDDCGDYPDAKVVCIAAQGQADWNNFRNGTKLYAAPQLPQPAVMSKDLLEGFEEWYSRGREDGDTIAPEWFSQAIKPCFEETWKACRAAMLQGAEPVQRWIPCSERMPEGMQTVITSNGFDIGQGWWDGEGWNSFGSHDVVPGKVTHWMPLPAAPQQEVK